MASLVKSRFLLCKVQQVIKLHALFFTLRGGFYVKVRAFTTPLLWFGGGELQFLQTTSHLRDLGIHVSTLPVDEMKRPDIVHFFGSYGKQYEGLFKYCIDNEIPYVVSTIFGVSNATLKNKVFNRLSKTILRHNALEGHVFRRFKMLPEFFNGAAKLLPNTSEEAELLGEYFPRLKHRIEIIPNGVEDRFTSGNDTLIRDKFHIEGKFILNVGRLEPRKNQYRLIEAVKLLGADAPCLVLVGDHSVDLEYTKICKKAVEGANVIFAGHIGHEDPLLESAYAGATVFALPSYQETPGISALEAYTAGASIVVTEVGGAKEYLAERAYYVNPFDISDISQKLRSAMNQDSLPNTPVDIECFLDKYSWKSVAKKTIDVYERVLNQGN